MTVGLFPGQGISAKVILKALPRTDHLLTRANEVLGFDLRAKVEAASRRSSDRLQTELAQPAIFVGSLISCRQHVREGIHFRQFIGHSLGEYPALAAAKAFSFEDGLRAVAVRGRAMQRAADASPGGGMVALIGLPLGAVSEVIRGAGVHLANDNSPNQVVVAGHGTALDIVGSLARARGGRAVRLPVEAAFHSEAMNSACDALSSFLFGMEIRSPGLPVISNVTSRPYRSPGEIRRLLVSQLTRPVRFRESIHEVWQLGGRNFVDLGPGSVLAPLASQCAAPLVVEESLLDA